MVNIAKIFSDTGNNVVIAMDNRKYHHHSKASTILQDSNAEKARVECILLCQKLMGKIQQYRDVTLTTKQLIIILDEMDSIEKTK